MSILNRFDQELFIQEHLAAIVESSDDAIITKSLQGIITSWNNAAEQMFGYTAQEAIGQSITMLIPSDRTEEESQILARIEAGKKVDHFETVRIRKNGEPVFVSATISPLRDNTGKIVGASKIVRDITHLRKINIDTKSSVYLQAVGELALVSITDYRGNIVHANQKFCEVSGYSVEELIGRNHRILNSGRHPRTFWTDMWGKVAKGNSWRREVCNRGKNGQLYWVDSTIVPLKNEQGKIDGYLSVRVDVTKAKLQEIALHERLKESICLYEIRRELLPKSTLEQVCRRTITELVKAMQFPEIAVVKIELSGEQFFSDNFTDNLSYYLHAEIRCSDGDNGKLQVFYLENKPFQLPAEQNLINLVAEDLGKWFDRKKAEELINHLATHDALTNLPNRYLFEDRLIKVLSMCRRSHEKAAVLFVDLDYFKVINDSLGHEIGDYLLKEIAERLLSCVRGQDTVARQGGDEFIVILQGIVKALDASVVAQKILDRLCQPYSIREEELHIGSSIGIAIYPDDGDKVDVLLRKSDIAMYHAKENGRNNFQFFTPKMNELALERYNLGTDLRQALERDELRLYFQPVIDMPNGAMKSVEALVRWQHPKLGLLSPIKFIGLAEEMGLIVSIGEWVLKTACLQIKAWQEQHNIVPKMAINLSFRQFRHKKLVSDIRRILNETAIDASNLTLEITESMLAQDVGEAVKILNRLSSMGLSIAMDDFGTGYSSLSYLKRFPIDTLKIDRSFVRDIATDTSDAAIVTAIIAMAHSLQMNVIAEGVETEEQIEFLTQKGCNRFQGYYFSKPVLASKIAERLKHVTVN